MKSLFLGMWGIGSSVLILFLINRLSAAWIYRKKHPLMQETVMPSAGSRPRRASYAAFPLKHLREELDLAELRLGVEILCTAMAVLALLGFIGSDALLQFVAQYASGSLQDSSMRHIWVLSAVIGLMSGSIPYFAVRFRVQQKRHRIALRMIVLVQNVIGHYRPHTTVADIVSASARTMPYEVHAEWKRLELALHMKPMDEALYEFAARVDNPWAHDLIDLLLIGAHYGTDMTDSLHHLVGKMQSAKRHEENRLAMITVYRLGTSFMVFFAFFVIGFNIYADRMNYRHYFMTSTGRMLVLVSLIVMFASMAFVIRSGRKMFKEEVHVRGIDWLVCRF